MEKLKDFITPGSEFDLSNITPQNITVNRIETLIKQVERNSAREENYKNQELTTILQASFTDKVQGWMHSEEEIIELTKRQIELEDDLACKVQEILKMNDFVAACPIELNEIKAGSLGLFVLKRERYYGFHQSENLVISSNDSMNAIKKIYGNNLPSCLLCNVVFSMKTVSTKPSALMPTPGTEFYVVDLEVQKLYDSNY
ncbi:hypothetical protein DICPUDRAFT_94634 [Dictyostelium purpureum]|uniref:Uncharacterized protein n=1 Tax=Dictyostelium purpureum TaxID=5786 RepID=F0ZLU0_DICPU|nr:uncharacterized protein DICPUDRAFT_94634 [Dictyostelium purpureum]EGC35088.1 hypothetical protein DICPUDRAFT_94634 [Dictyostelium purpureum]|eukprot:XP_003288395.1 hypothetical protein DICPUDRAFT_94634 [Dictyostelium purpureum]